MMIALIWTMTIRFRTIPVGLDGVLWSSHPQSPGQRVINIRHGSLTRCSTVMRVGLHKRLEVMAFLSRATYCFGFFSCDDLAA
jgi:hypothetical protein